jgi:hypothetical protein
MNRQNYAPCQYGIPPLDISPGQSAYPFMIDLVWLVYYLLMDFSFTPIESAHPLMSDLVWLIYYHIMGFYQFMVCGSVESTSYQECLSLYD